MYVGLVVGPLVGGALTNTQTLSPLGVLYVAAGCFMLASVIVLVMPETRTKERRTKFNFLRANPFGGIAVLCSDSVTLRVVGLEIFSMLTLCGVATLTPTLLVQAATALEKPELAAFSSYFYASLFASVSFGNLILPVWIKARTT